VLEHVPGLDVMVPSSSGPTMSAETLQSVHMARRMASSFKTLHSAPSFLQDFNMFRLIENYLRIVDEHGVVIPRGYPTSACGRAEIERAVSVHALPPSHAITILLCENFNRRRRIAPHRRLRAQRQNNDPCFDLGNTAQEAIFGETCASALRGVLRAAGPTAAGAHEPVRRHVRMSAGRCGARSRPRSRRSITTSRAYYASRWARAVAVMDTDRFQIWLREAAG